MCGCGRARYREWAVDRWAGDTCGQGTGGGFRPGRASVTLGLWGGCLGGFGYVGAEHRLEPRAHSVGCTDPPTGSWGMELQCAPTQPRLGGPMNRGLGQPWSLCLEQGGVDKLPGVALGRRPGFQVVRPAPGPGLRMHPPCSLPASLRGLCPERAPQRGLGGFQSRHAQAHGFQTLHPTIWNTFHIVTHQTGVLIYLERRANPNLHERALTTWRAFGSFLFHFILYKMLVADLTKWILQRGCCLAV